MKHIHMCFRYFLPAKSCPRTVVCCAVIPLILTQVLVISMALADERIKPEPHDTIAKRISATLQATLLKQRQIPASEREQFISDFVTLARDWAAVPDSSVAILRHSGLYVTRDSPEWVFPSVVRIFPEYRERVWEAYSIEYLPNIEDEQFTPLTLATGFGNKSATVLLLGTLLASESSTDREAAVLAAIRLCREGVLKQQEAAPFIVHGLLDAEPMVVDAISSEIVNFFNSDVVENIQLNTSGLEILCSKLPSECSDIQVAAVSLLVMNCDDANETMRKHLRQTLKRIRPGNITLRLLTAAGARSTAGEWKRHIDSIHLHVDEMQVQDALLGTLWKIIDEDSGQHDEILVSQLNTYSTIPGMGLIMSTHTPMALDAVITAFLADSEATPVFEHSLANILQTASTAWIQSNAEVMKRLSACNSDLVSTEADICMLRAGLLTKQQSIELSRMVFSIQTVYQQRFRLVKELNRRRIGLEADSNGVDEVLKLAKSGNGRLESLACELCRGIARNAGSGAETQRLFDTLLFSADSSKFYNVHLSALSACLESPDGNELVHSRVVKSLRDSSGSASVRRLCDDLLVRATIRD